MQLGPVFNMVQLEQDTVEYKYPDSKVHGANMGPTWVLSAPEGPHVGPKNFAIRKYIPHILPSPVSYGLFIVHIFNTLYGVLTFRIKLTML